MENRYIPIGRYIDVNKVNPHLTSSVGSVSLNETMYHETNFTIVCLM